MRAVIALAVLAVVVAVPVWSMRYNGAPGPVTPLVGLRYLLLCAACLLLSLAARQDPVLTWLWPCTLGASVVFTGLVVVVLVDDVRGNSGEYLRANTLHEDKEVEKCCT